jgi:Sulfotransferase family
MSDQRFLFIHIMKTAGGTLRQQIRANFEREQIYPSERVDNMLAANTSLQYLTRLSAGRRAQVRVFTGHFPFMALDLLGEALTTITILRNPVERTLSYLRQRQRNDEMRRGLPLEEIYEDPDLFPSLIRDHQAKLFALTLDDQPLSFGHVLDVDASRLEIAKRNIERVDVIGIQDRFDELLRELERRFGWRRAPVVNQNVDRGAGDPIPASFRRRIAEENQADMEFFEHAVRLYEQRRRNLALP